MMCCTCRLNTHNPACMHTDRDATPAAAAAVVYNPVTQLTQLRAAVTALVSAPSPSSRSVT
jgi:hypothetical protein